MSKLKNDLIQEIYYPDTDGKPMAENTRQYEWIVTIKGNLDSYLPDFVAGDLFWYPVEGQPSIHYAPDVMVAVGRPKGHRLSYKQWEENNIAPQVVFEILSPGNTEKEMQRKLSFYQKYGVQEYYVFDPEPKTFRLNGWLRAGEELLPIVSIHNWTSPLLDFRFQFTSNDLVIYRPDNKVFLTFAELIEREQMASLQVEEEHKRAEEEHKRAEQEHERANRAEKQLKELLEKIKAMGVEM